MPHDVYVSHSTKDNLASDAVVGCLERNGLRCWTAPRDIGAGEEWADSILAAIGSCKVMVLVASERGNRSERIRKEIARAILRGIPVVPVRIYDIVPQEDLESSHWMDAITPPMVLHFEQLSAQLRSLIGDDKGPVPTKDAAVVSAPARSGSLGRAAMWIGVVVGAAALGGTGVWLTTGRNNQLATTVAPGKQLVIQPSPKPAVQPTEPSPQPPIQPVAQPSPQPAIQPVTQPSPLVAIRPPESQDTSPIPEPVQNASTAPATMPDVHPVIPPPPQPTVATRSVADDYQAWQKLALTHLDNSYVVENGPTRYAAWRHEADAGDPIAEFLVGYCYARGAGVQADEVEALRWFRRSADAGNADAMVQIGVSYLLGYGTPINPPLWLGWMKRAADAENVGGMVCLGTAFIGRPDAASQDQGRSYLKRAAAAGSADATFVLAYAEGLAPADFLPRIQPIADAGQPHAMLIQAERMPAADDQAALRRRALKLMAGAQELSNFIELPAGSYPFSDPTKQAVWERLHELSDGGYAAASRAIATLKKKGFADPLDHKSAAQ